MRQPPAYFEEIRQKSAKRWEQLEQDPELAGPWHQLFKQVQSPRHILSELLQNADDAGASEASVYIKDSAFYFEHNGEDFSEQHFASLCRFGYSNKRALHTIGFRGIGFKSTFSLGDCVELFTASLSVCFKRKRFTEPLWLESEWQIPGRTLVRVMIADQHRQREVDKNLNEWLKSPVSLLFFKHLRRLTIGHNVVHWQHSGPGPVQESQWMTLANADVPDHLLIRSAEEPFPDEALAEIHQERMLGIGDVTVFPPCRIEIVLGATGRLYVVLPTGVDTSLPFACNAPFIQDPARLKIKDPETSPTNRWLLERVGKLAATSMLNWLSRNQDTLAERSRAYNIFPSVDRNDNSLSGVSSSIVEEAFEKIIDGKNLLLTEDGRLLPENQSIIIPFEISEIWDTSTAAVLFDVQGRPPFCRHVSSADQERILAWQIVERVSHQKILAVLQSQSPPRPDTWMQLLKLWTYVASDASSFRYFVRPTEIRIIPVQGRDSLFAGKDVVRLGEKRLLQSDGDWNFLAKYLIAVNQNWPRFLAEQRRLAVEKHSEFAAEVESAYALLEKFRISEASDANKILEAVAKAFFSQEVVEIADCIQLAQIGAKLGASAVENFRFVTRDGSLCAVGGALFDENGDLEVLIPEALRESRLLHAGYTASFNSCTREDWHKWVTSGRANLGAFVPLVQKKDYFHGRKKAETEANRRGVHRALWYRYVTDFFRIEDWDFEDAYWDYWQKSAAGNSGIWVRVALGILAQLESYRSKAACARILQIATTYSESMVTTDPLCSSWVLRLRDYACLPDRHGFNRRPDELLRRTPATEFLIDVEPFVDGHLDNESTRLLLDLLGVRCVPTGPDRLLECLRALSKADKPPVNEIEKWCRRLDQMMSNCSSVDFERIKGAFLTEKLILTQDGAWSSVNSVFLSSGQDDVPGSAVVRSSMEDLTLWRKIGVADRPTVELAIEWLKSIPSGAMLAPVDFNRVKGLLGRHPSRIWEQCRHWVNLAGEWAPTAGLVYAVSMHTLTGWANLHLWVKQKTADLRWVRGEDANGQPFSALSSLAALIEERFQKDPNVSSAPLVKDWLSTFGSELSRIELNSIEEARQVQNTARTLAATKWCEASGLETVPYIGGVPAGVARRADVIWQGQTLFVERMSKAKLARRVPEEIGRAFGRSDIKAALDYSFERSSSDVREYLEENFKLSPPILEADWPAVVSPAIDEAGRPLGGNPAGSFSDVPADPVSAAPPERPLIASLEAESLSSGEVVTVDPVEVGAAASDGEFEATHRLVRSTPHPARVSLLERFALAHGYRRDGDARYVDALGNRIVKTSSSRFPWECLSASGDLKRYYLPKEHCLERESLEVEADVWGLLTQRPDTYAMILLSLEGQPVELTGTRLSAMSDDGSLVLHPATYRIVHA